MRRSGLMPGNTCGSPTAFDPSTHHTNTLLHRNENSGVLTEHYGTPARRPASFVGAVLMRGSPHPGVVPVSKG